MDTLCLENLSLFLNLWKTKTTHCAVRPKFAVITGGVAARTLGCAIANLLLNEPGFGVYLLSDASPCAQRAIKELRAKHGLPPLRQDDDQTLWCTPAEGLNAQFRYCDLSDDESLSLTVEWFQQAHPDGIDVLINNLGAVSMPLTPESAEITLKRNLFDTWNTINKFMPAVKDDTGRIITVCPSSGQADHVNKKLLDRVNSEDITLDDVHDIVREFLQDVRIVADQLTKQGLTEPPMPGTSRVDFKQKGRETNGFSVPSTNGDASKPPPPRFRFFKCYDESYRNMTEEDRKWHDGMVKGLQERGWLCDSSVTPCAPDYSVAKLGIGIITRILAKNDRGIQISQFCPGWTTTEADEVDDEQRLHGAAETALWMATTEDSDINGKFFHAPDPDQTFIPGHSQELDF